MGRSRRRLKRISKWVFGKTATSKQLLKLISPFNCGLGDAYKEATVMTFRSLKIANIVGDVGTDAVNKGFE